MQECDFDTVVKYNDADTVVKYNDADTVVKYNDADTVCHIDSAYRDENGKITWYDVVRISNGVKFRRMFSPEEITIPPIEQE